MLARRVQAAGPSAVGFFYYSGHGASDGSTNYLILVDVKTTETGELWDQSLRLTEIMRKLKAEAGNGTHFVVFDACRNTLKLRQPGSRAVVPWLKRTACSSRTRRPRVSSPPTWAPTLAPMPKCFRHRGGRHVPRGATTRACGNPPGTLFSMLSGTCISLV